MLGARQANAAELLAGSRGVDRSQVRASPVLQRVHHARTGRKVRAQGDARGIGEAL